MIPSAVDRVGWLCLSEASPSSSAPQIGQARKVFVSANNITSSYAHKTEAHDVRRERSKAKFSLRRGTVPLPLVASPTTAEARPRAPLKSDGVAGSHHSWTLCGNPGLIDRLRLPDSDL